MRKITIVDYDSGNLNVLVKKLHDFGFEAHFTKDKQEIANAGFLLIPGVGHFGSSMKKMQEYGLIDVLSKKVLVEKVPVVGICLGMQLFSEYSEEGNMKGLGWIDATTKYFKFSDKSCKIPHIGWNALEVNDQQGTFMDKFKEQNFYFVHSYYFECKDPANVLTYTRYCNQRFCSSVLKDNILGFQFHPEKSHRGGMEMLAAGIKVQMEKYG